MNTMSVLHRRKGIFHKIHIMKTRWSNPDRHNALFISVLRSRRAGSNMQAHTSSQSLLISNGQGLQS